MKKNIPVIATAVVAVCIIAIVAVLGIKAANSGPDIQANATTGATDPSTYYYPEETTTNPFLSMIESTTALIEEVTSTTAAETTTKKETTTNKETTTKAPETEVTVPQLDPNEMESGSSGEPPVSPGKDLPKDMSLYGLRVQGYDVIGLKEYIYNNDTKEGNVQHNFGYNPIYDWGASLIDFTIETCRVKFTYGEKDYMIQMWKGQYISGEIGTVGGEIGLYHRPKGKVSAIDHYDCAEKSEWINMELTVLWDEFNDGVYRPQLTRNYGIHWWITGYVDGQLPNKKDSSPLRLLCRMTYRNEEFAKEVEQGLIDAGFTPVSTFKPDVKDTFKRYGKDIIFLWQDVR